MNSNEYEVLIIGGGISGGTLLYNLALHSDVQSMCLLEKYDHLDPLNSNAHSNSQTLHCGDIETNYNREKAEHVQGGAELMLQFVNNGSGDATLKRNYGKMLLGVGDEEVAFVKERFDLIFDLYPTLMKVGPDEIADIEPNVALVDGELREESIYGLYNPEGWAIDYGKVTENCVAQAQEVKGKTVEVKLSSEAIKLTRTENGFEVKVKNGDTLHCKFLVVSAGTYSLHLAQTMGKGKHFSVLPVSGSFYFAPEVLHGKVYTVQNPKLPFAAIHGDPDMTKPNTTRFGPTALMLPVLERFNAKSAVGFLESFHFSKGTATTLFHLMKDKDIREFIYENIGYEVPIHGKKSFLKQVVKIVPSMQLDDLDFADHTTGVRPQLIDEEKGELLMGAAKFSDGDGVIFNMTPSPGATSAFANAAEDLVAVTQYLDKQIDKKSFKSVFGVLPS
ncbi:MAG: FAD-dependent oxidoreductase [Phycisphaerae bacterium]|nr:FAD-dependent oxidoreductase [Phycisphaerae bacterium]MBT6269345.1 FAD-dependent oxidoreductase [Phycisphaerae bacterium]MBT6282669.1 FAD-dependent oxidoreductase [Phycisphaerae bacterium]